MAGDLHRNARALRQVSALAGAGWTVHVVSLAPAGALRSNLPEGVTNSTIDLPHTGGPRYFARLRRRFKRELAGLSAALFHASDLYVLAATASRARESSAPYTYDARELYTHVAATVGRPHVRAAWHLVESRFIRGAARTWTVSDSIADRLRGSYGIARPTVQMNAPAYSGPPAPGDYLRTESGLSPETAIVLHLGQLRRDRGAEMLIRAMASWPDDAPRAALVFLGYGPEERTFRELTTTLGAEGRVRFLPPVPPARVLGVAAGADCGVTLLEPTCLNHRFALPNKLFDYLAAGLPVVASDLPECAALIERFECGVVADPLSEDSVRGALVKAVSGNADTERWRRNATAAAETLDWNAVSETFCAQVAELIPRK